jgi:DNA mismatch repair protein MutL
MNVINKLAAHVADLIAAGEVVERPASVVKELIENAIDAGAKTVTVEIQRGGMSYIRVSDDGCGMSPEDASTAFLRHATSKLRDQYGLEAIKTLGFRGEALAAIAAVSRIQLLTAKKAPLRAPRLRLRRELSCQRKRPAVPREQQLWCGTFFSILPPGLSL